MNRIILDLKPRRKFYFPKLVSFRLALNWLCFLPPSKRKILHNHLSYKTLCQFRPTANWVCFFKSHPFNSFRISNFVLRISGRRPVLVLFFQIGFQPPAVLGANRDWLCLALNWVCFFAAQNRKMLHNPLSYKTLRHFHPATNWLCFFNLTTNSHE